jgi:hypothetical protein
MLISRFTSRFQMATGLTEALVATSFFFAQKQHQGGIVGAVTIPL